MIKSCWLSLAVVFLVASASAQQQPASASWDPWQFLIGEWVAEGRGRPGQGTGSFSFEPGLQRKILVRKNRADYPTTKDRPAFSHEDLMVIYREPEGRRTRAIYFDNEGHVIEYTAEVSPEGKTATFISDLSPSAPRFRLTYARVEDQVLAIKFEIAQPGKPDAFATYIEAVAHRKNR